MENINLNLLPKEGAKILEELASGRMVIARSKNDFLYILKFDDKFHMFSHSPGNDGGGQKQFPVDEKYTAAVKKIADLSDTLYTAEFDKELSLYGVMASAEEGILSMFPGDDRNVDSDIEFVLPNKDNQDDTDK